MSKIPVFDIGDTLFPTVKIYREVVRQEAGIEDVEIGNFNIFDPESSESYFAEKEIRVDGKRIRNRYIERVERYMIENDRLEMLRKCSEEFGPIGIISDNWSYAGKMYKNLFEEHGVEFQGVVISEDVGVTKPDEKIFRAFLKRRGESAERFVYFGNHGVRDSAAKKLGMGFVFTTEYFNFDTEYDGRTISNLSFETVKEAVKQ